MSQYIKRNLPRPGEDVVNYVINEFTAIEKAFVEPNEFISLAVQYKAPSKIRVGMIVLADGSEWNPGSGEGVYCYRSGAWHLLG